MNSRASPQKNKRPSVSDAILLPTPLARVDWLKSDTFVRDPYRALVNTGRTYAAFSEEELGLLTKLLGSGPVLDPMSGYGLVTHAGARLDVSTHSVELNPPQFLWQLLTAPANRPALLPLARRLLDCDQGWPKAQRRAVSDEDWFSRDSIAHLDEIWQRVLSVVEEVPGPDGIPPVIQVAAILLPFAGRFSTSTPGVVSSHVKRGGLCVFEGWEEDLRAYLHAIIKRLGRVPRSSQTHAIDCGDSCQTDLSNVGFGSLFTSPPYPNRHVYRTFFAPENEILAHWRRHHGLDLGCPAAHLIGANRIPDLKQTDAPQEVVCRFLETLRKRQRSERAKYDDRVYYFPYFNAYFTGLAKVFTRVAEAAPERFTGFVFAVNNTHRGRVIPVAEAVCETWQSLGFEAEVQAETEVFHVGTKNPRARGRRAMHSHYVVRVRR